MKPPLALIAALLTNLQLFASHQPIEATVFKSNDKSVEITTSSRTNGCKLELRRWTGKSKSTKEYWSQDVSCGDDKLLHLLHQVTIDDRERSLVCVPDEKYQIHQLDRDLDGIYDMILVVRTTGLELLDVLVFEKAGYLRHASKEEFETRLAIANRNKQALEELDKITQEAFKKFNKQGLPLSPQATSVK